MAPRSLLTMAVSAGLLLQACADTRESEIADPSQPSPVGGTLVEQVENGLVPMTESAEPLWDERATLSERMLSYKVPGLGIAIIEDFEIAWSKGYGTLRAGGEELVTSQTLFHAGSLAKCLSAAATLTLVEDGRLELDRDVARDLKSWTLPQNELTRDEKVTLRRLLSHSAGLADGFTDRSSGDRVPSYFTPEGSAPTVTLSQLLDGAPDVDVDGPTRVVAVPGARYRYANADYAILELLLGDVTGQPFAQFVEDTVLGPLELTSSTYEQPLPPELRRRAAVEHDLSGQPIAGDRLHIPLRAAGGLWTTPSDLATFVAEILRAYRGESESLLSQAGATEMLTRQVAIEENPVADAAGLGFQLGGSGDDLYLVHTGGTWGSTSILWAYPATGQGLVIMTNSASGSLLRFEILLGIAGVYGWPLGR